MARGKQFLSLVTTLRDELGRSNSVAVGVDDLPRLKNAINRAYENVADTYTWPHLRTTVDQIALNAGQRFYDLPSVIDFDKIEQARIWFTALPIRIRRGISLDQYIVYNSQLDQRSDPVMRWDIRWMVTVEQIEVWPIPASSSQTLQFIGQTKITRMVNDADVALLDDWLIVLKAKESLTKPGDDRTLAVAEFKERLDELKTNAFSNEEPVRVGLGPSNQQDAPEKVTILVR